MTFSSAPFLFLFLPLTVLLYYSPLCRSRAWRNGELLLASILFYAWGEPVLVLLLLGEVALNWLFGILIEAEKSAKRKVYLGAALVLDLGVLFVFKYLTFTLKNLARFVSIHVLEIALPIGISFYTFQILSYVLDVYRGTVPAQRNLGKLALYVLMFPQLVAGPIVRYNAINEQLDHRQESWPMFADGVCRFGVGLAKKVLLADMLGQVVDNVFGKASVGSVSAAAAWIGAIAYTLEIYYDFSGYSDMAIGLGACFGFTFEENFTYPYIAASVSEFWRRWHISLTNWFRDYVYIPLGGNRCSKRRHVLNLLAVWLLTGIWHGANWTFIVWGLLYFVFQLAEKYTGFPKRLPLALRHLYVLLVVTVEWVIFRADSLTDAGHYLLSMLDIAHFWDADAAMLAANCLVLLCAAVLGCFPWRSLLQKRGAPQAFVETAAGLGTAAAFLLSVLLILDGAYSPFIYFNF